MELDSSVFELPAGENNQEEISNQLTTDRNGTVQCIGMRESTPFHA